ncbi:MAG: hypothetical protein OXC91_06150 [Rhodobacteraceae bacterium]|nr:hypothetical protein [Paracoccaceae bacterium]
MSAVRLCWRFIRQADPVGIKVDWLPSLREWLTRFDASGRFQFDLPISCQREDRTARDDVGSNRPDPDCLSVAGTAERSG